MTAPTIGIEEEFLVVDPVSRAPVPASGQVVAAAAALGDHITSEFSLFQVEVKTPPCVDSSNLRSELIRLRAGAADAAGDEGLRLCASGTPVLGNAGPLPVGDHPRYRAGVDQYRAMLDDFVVCALHVHVFLPDRECAVLVGNHIRPWLPVLLALSANSPFHQGRDTGYASWRAAIRSRFPCLGPPPYAESLRQHEELAAGIAESGAMLDAALPFWDVRANPRLPTVEVRAMDVVADVDDTVALAVLVRALVAAALGRVRAADTGPHVCSELLRAAYWRAARDGWSGCGYDVLNGQAVPAQVLAARLVDEVKAGLHQHGDAALVAAFLDRLAARGGGADQQRARADQAGGLTAVVDDLIARTTART